MKQLPAGIKDNLDDPILYVLLSEWRGLDEISRHVANLHEEQEGEIAHEVQQTTEIKCPKRATACKHEIDKRATDFIQSGFFEYVGRAKPVFETLQNTSAEAHIPYQLKAPVYSSEDFVRTVEADCYDDYLRPVIWDRTNMGRLVDAIALKAEDFEKEGPSSPPASRVAEC